MTVSGSKSAVRNPHSAFPAWFHQATGHFPYHYQARLALDEAMPSLLHVPTGLGKTAAAILAWLWRRREAPPEVRAQTPRRLVYCLPMRVLVEQTRDNTVLWLRRLDLLGGVAQVVGSGREERVRDYTPSWSDPNRIAVSVLMGGEDADEWDLYPERDAILIGTQDMLLSRALNRGYASGRARWPKDFALLNNDCLWIFDEVQLMGSGFATSLQLQAWRQRLLLRPDPTAFPGPKEGTVAAPVRSLWMSATLERDWLDQAVDFREYVAGVWDESEAETQRLWGEDLQHEDDIRVLLTENRKHLKPARHGKSNDTLTLKREQEAEAEYLDRLTDAVTGEAEKVGDAQLVLVIVNTVKRAVGLYERLHSRERLSSRLGDPATWLFLLHSRFRGHERRQWMDPLRAGQSGTRVIIATQVVEAGVDISADVLFTEACPWPSLIQRLGRCARGVVWKDGEPAPQTARVFWTDVSADPKPYGEEEIKSAVDEIPSLGTSANIEALKRHSDELSAAERRRLLPYEPRFVPRDKDLFELFDTTPDLTGADVDIARFIRDAEELDVQVFWRECDEVREGARPPKKCQPHHDELCPVPVRAFRDDFMKTTHRGRIWRWDYRDGWTPITLSEMDRGRVYPGQIFLLEAACGGYRLDVGWTGDPEDQGFPVGPWPEPRQTDQTEQEDADASDESDALSETGEGDEWRDIVGHTREVCCELERLLRDNCGNSLANSIPDDARAVLRLAARLHDWGKAHHAFQAKLKPEALAAKRPDLADALAAKAPDDCWRRDRLRSKPTDTPEDTGDNRRPRFRHELASALAILEVVRRARPDHPAVAWPPDAELRDAFASDNQPATEPLPPEAKALTAEIVALDGAELDLLLYLVAAHHGKVRMSLRRVPDDTRGDVPDPCPPDRCQARGVRDGDPLPSHKLPGPDAANVTEPVTAPAVTLCLDPMELGLSTRYGRSWRERTQALLETHGPFRLAWYEALLRVADARASKRIRIRKPDGR